MRISPTLFISTLVWVGQISGQVTPADHAARVACYQPLDSRESIYDFKYRDLFLKKTRRFDRIYRDHVLLIVNIATYCDYTWQYHGMNALQERFGSQKFKILAFPCNQFGKMQPGDNATEIMNGIRYVRPGGGFEPLFPHFEMVDVNGAKEAQIYTYLKTYCPTTSLLFTKDIYYKPIRVGDVYWNWEKFLIGTDGRVVSRYHASVDPLDKQLVNDIIFQLHKTKHFG